MYTHSLYLSCQNLHRERTEAVAVEITSPVLEEAPFKFPESAANNDTAQKVTPWDVEGAVVDGKQVRSNNIDDDSRH